MLIIQQLRLVHINYQRKLLKNLEKKNTSVICRELKGVDTNVVLRSCDGCIEDALQTNSL